tara:strand:- start:4960 stop:5097 length:138 start_codon:yes stop_codon:yes gene_type:complete
MEDIKTYSIMGTGLIISVLDIIPILQAGALIISIIYGIIQIKQKL